MSPIPTVTLAKLFESQEQYVEALALYNILFKKNQDNKFLETIEELKNKIFDNNENEYHQFLLSIFNQEERKSLKILPHSQAEDYLTALKQFSEAKESKSNSSKKMKNSQQAEYHNLIEELDQMEPAQLEEQARNSFNKSMDELTLAEIKQLIEQKG